MEIYRLIASEPKQWTCGRLAKLFQCSRTQISKDIKELREKGLIIESTPKGFYILPE
ncbi:MAG: helix-turn-helix domain-containing protein [Candidatus Omnitrophica bacterium]|nr:helix-turn-helix domain-containing protein [Candidatus Omnitrophota bacterium]